MVPENTSGPIDCACVIHGNGYSWEYVDKLYNMLSRHLTRKIRLHVYTEAERAVPEPYIKHSLIDLGISGPKQSWWYKMQLFNSEYHSGPMLYFDLDTVIVNNIDWITELPLNYFWTVKDFKYLWNIRSSGINSSVMWWDTSKFDYIWKNFKIQDLTQVRLKYRGDQDFITDAILQNDRRFFNTEYVKSWRWECLDGGYNFAKKQHFRPNLGTTILPHTSILVFHGNPKPDKVTDNVIVQHWQ